MSTRMKRRKSKEIWIKEGKKRGGIKKKITRKMKENNKRIYKS